MKKIIVAGAVLATLALGACDSDDSPAAVGVCTDPRTGVRVDDYYCDGHVHDGISGWEMYYILSTLNQPRVGAQVVHNTYYSNTTVNKYAGFKPPQSVTVEKGVPKAGWTASKGSSSFVPKDKSNITAPKVIQQAPKPMYQPKQPVNKPPVYKAPAPRR